MDLPTDTELYRRIRLFEECSRVEQGRILYAAAKNDLRASEVDTTIHSETLKKLWPNSLDEWSSIGEGLGIADNTTCPRHMTDLTTKKLSGGNWLETLSEIIQLSIELAPGDPWFQSLNTNVALAQRGLCPLLHYAFGKWWTPTTPGKVSKATIRKLVELGTTYLYRIAQRPRDAANTSGTILAHGAYSWIVGATNGDRSTVLKIPRNLAGTEIALRQEAAVYEKLIGTSFAPYIPRIDAFDRASQMIRREYIRGPLGHALLLRNRLKRADPRFNALRTVFETAVETMIATDTRLDIHPGNFVWDEGRGRWILVDLGPPPYIGFDYYPLRSFESYWEQIWAQRLRRMRNQPIRSVDISIQAA